jgi:hypothetical protein
MATRKLLALIVLSLCLWPALLPAVTWAVEEPPEAAGEEPVVKEPVVKDPDSEVCNPAGGEDCEPPVLQLPERLTVDTSSFDGVVVQFVVTAMDGIDPEPRVVCDPSSGSIFAVGTVTVTCTATDSSGNVSLSGTFTVTVKAPPALAPDAPDANDDSVDTVQDVPVQIAYLTNDVDPSSDAVARIDGQPTNGAAEMAGGLFTYTPQPGYVGTDGFTYQLCRAESTVACDSATVTVHVRRADGMTGIALADPTWQVMSQRPFEGIPDNCKGALAWGGYPNGRIPKEAMFSVGSPHTLEREAAAQFLAMRAASKQVGIALPLTDSYRSYEAQVEVRARKGAIVATATPGTSVHGWAKAIDINLQASPGLQAWLEQHAVRFGWVNPAWARRPGKSYEPWHYEFYGAKPGTETGGVCAATTTAAPALNVPAAPAAPPSPQAEPVVVSPTSFLARTRSVGGLVGLAALGIAVLAARFAVKEFWSRHREP